jgi:MFS family permease
LIWGLPTVGLPGLGEHRWRLVALIVLVSLHQLLEYMGQIALWSWLADIVPPRVRGRYFGRRQILQLLVLIPTLLLAGNFSDRWRERCANSRETQLLAYAIPNAVGSAFLLCSLVPLALMPATAALPGASRPISLTFAPLADKRFRRLMLYGCWFSFFNGITQVPQNAFPKLFLGLGVQALSAMRIAMQCGQMLVAAWAGPFSDRYGNRPTLIASQLVLATAPAFMLLATPHEPWWFAGAWLAWSAYAGLNICLPNLMLKFAERDLAASYIACYFAATSVFYAASTLLGGYVFDLLGQYNTDSWILGFDRYHWAFAGALVARSLAVLLLLWIPESGAWTWRDILGRRRRGSA